MWKGLGLSKMPMILYEKSISQKGQVVSGRKCCLGREDQKTECKNFELPDLLTPKAQLTEIHSPLLYKPI